MPELSLALWFVYFVFALGLRVALSLRRTGHTGLVITRTRPGSVQWVAETMELVALGLAVAAPLLALADTVEPIAALDGHGAHGLGVVLFAGGLALLIVSQERMGASWRIGVAQDERTDLVTSGPFGVVRNPIFVALAAVQTGQALLVPSAVALVGVLLQLVSIEAQVRLVEEPYLRRTHGETWTDYARRVGRFIPTVGRLKASV